MAPVREFVIATIIGIAAGPAVAQPSSRFAAVHDAVSAAIAAETAPGAIVLIRQNNKVVFSEALGTSDGQPLKTDTVFWVASMTKPLVAASVLMLVEEGKVRLDDPVSRYIPEFARTRQVRTLKPGQALPSGPPGSPAPKLDWSFEPARRALTVRDMITMTGGLQTIRVPNEAIPPVLSTDNLASFTAKLGDAPLDFQPGSRWGYSNATEFEVAARIVEVASGMLFPDFVQKRLFDPLGMSDSHFGLRTDLRPRLAPLGNMAESPLTKGFPSGSAGLWTTAEDYSRFAQMLLDGGRANGRRILKAETVRSMSANQIGEASLGGLTPGEYGGLPGKTNPAVKYGYGVIAGLADPKGAGTSVPAGSYGWDGVGTRRFWVMPQQHAVLIMLVSGGQADVLHRAIERAATLGLAR